jgi:hypothetical protein
MEKMMPKLNHDSKRKPPILTVVRTYRKAAREGEIAIYREILNPIAAKYNGVWLLLMLPEALSIDNDHGILELPFYEGETFNDKWNEQTGGALLGLDLSSEIPRLIRELASIDATVITKNERLKNVPLVFDQATYCSALGTKFEKFFRAGVLDKESIERASELMREPYSSLPIVNNGDFYPRNLIRTPARRIVLIDWEAWNPRSPFYVVDYPENIAAVCFVHMWNNRSWQEQYARHLLSLFSMKERDFQKAILIKSLELASLWFNENGRNELCQNQIGLFRNALNEKYMKELLS